MNATRDPGRRQQCRKSTASVFLTLCVAIAAVPRVAAQVESLPPDHWAYEQLERFEARGHIVLPGVRPWSRAQVATWAATLRRAADDGDPFSSIELQRLARLEDEFVHGARIADAERRFDRPVVRILDENWNFAGDADLTTGGMGSVGVESGPESDGTAWGRGHLEVALRYRDWAVYDTRYRVSLEEEFELRTEENRISTRERNWNGLTSNHDRAYVALAGERVRFVLGRDYVAWGTSRGDELLVSDSGLSLDAMQFHLRVNRFRLASTTALLSAADNRNYAAHRLEVDFGSFWFGVQEAVVYVSPHFEPTYLFPLSFYYGNQFNERVNDNTLLGFDAKWSSRLGVLDGELLVDDFIYDGDPAPNKLGFRLGWRRGFVVARTDLDLHASYTRMNRWTFTHMRQGNAFVAGRGDPAAGDPFLGHPLGPDADRWRLAALWSPHLDWSTELSWTRARFGDGNRDLTSWMTGDPYDLGFPSGDVQHEERLGLVARARFSRALQMSAGGEVGWGTRGRELRIGAELGLDF